MEGTQNLQNQQSTSLQQPRSDLQTGQPTLAPAVPGQQQLTASELRVGSTSIKAGDSTNSPAAFTPADVGSSLLPLLWLLIPVVIAVIILWPSKKQAPVIEEAPLEPTPPLASPKKAKKKTANKSTKRKKSKR